MILFTVIYKNEEATNLRQNYFDSYATSYNNKQKGTSNKFAPEIF